MFRWYENAEVCYAYLSDVSSDVELENMSGEFVKSRWFTRGWTLQELVAPSNVVFYSKDWTSLGTKTKLSNLLSRITDINQEILEGGGVLEQVSVARRMSWAAARQTRRIEDIAYSLLGIFDVNMPLLYGEGTKAFFRLQEEILKGSNDQSIFVWGALQIIPSMEWVIQAESSRQQKTTIIKKSEVKPQQNQFLRGLLADSPAEFARCHNIVVYEGWPGSHGHPPIVYNKCIRIELPVLVDRRTGLSFAVLGCGIDSTEYQFEHYVAVVLQSWDGGAHFGRLQLALISAYNNQLSELDSVRDRMTTILVKQRGLMALPNL